MIDTPTPDSTATARARPKPKKMVKEMSSVTFPYVDLENAISVARAIITSGGVPMSREQLAGALKQSATSGAFILKGSAARQFGLVELKDGKFQLTDLGFSILDKNESKERGARAQAFLNVELYRRIYDEFRNRQLPPRPLGLEQAFVQMGVAQKQKSNARVAFEKSAKQAGYFNVDPDRLIEPVIGGASFQVADTQPTDLEPSSGSQSMMPNFGGLDPLIQGMIERLPPTGEPWSPEKRKRWLDTLEANLEMIYPPEPTKNEGG